MRILLPFLISIIIVGCQPEHDVKKLDDFSKFQLVEWNRRLTGVIVADIFTPPVASRIYAYPNIAAYEVLRFQDQSKKSFAERLTGFLQGPQPNSEEEYYFPLAGIVAFTTVSKALVYNGPSVEDLEAEYLEGIKKIGIDPGIYERSVSFGKKAGNHVLSWAGKDGYNERTAGVAFMVNDDPGRWRPTPPDYAEAIEPYWNTMRPFVIDSAGQFNPGSPTKFDTIPDSEFYKETLEVYETVKTIDEEKLAIAKFWDCNPNISYTQGHVMYFNQQISPGGHWIHITCQVAEAEALSELSAAETLAKVSITIADAFISCWDEKYRSSLVRPETYINRYIDKEWQPILQTPPFPEHTSGHSVASSSAATMLTEIFGERYYFQDSTEVPYGLPVREFESFYEASSEAAISRLYGGIHYMPAIKYGVSQGKKLGEYVISKIEKN